MAARVGETVVQLGRVFRAGFDPSQQPQYQEQPTASVAVSPTPHPDFNILRRPSRLDQIIAFFLGVLVLLTIILLILNENEHTAPLLAQVAGKIINDTLFSAGGAVGQQPFAKLQVSPNISVDTTTTAFNSSNFFDDENITPAP